jgi:hypothetical protein
VAVPDGLSEGEHDEGPKSLTCPEPSRTAICCAPKLSGAGIGCQFGRQISRYSAGFMWLPAVLTQVKGRTIPDTSLLFTILSYPDKFGKSLGGLDRSPPSPV